MTTLTDRMRTCAAAILAGEGEGGEPHETSMLMLRVTRDAADLLIEASNALEAAAQPQYPPNEPTMEIIPHFVPAPIPPASTGTWIGDDLKPALNAARSLNACPKCDSRAQKTIISIKGKQIWIECPVCGHGWQR